MSDTEAQMANGDKSEGEAAAKAKGRKPTEKQEEAGAKAVAAAAAPKKKKGGKKHKGSRGVKKGSKKK